MEKTAKHEEIMRAIKEKHEQTDGSCGLPIVDLLRAVNMTTDEARPFLNDLLTAKEFHVRKGINGKLLFYGTRQSKKRR